MLKNIDNVTNIQHILHLNSGFTGRLIQNFFGFDYYRKIRDA